MVWQRARSPEQKQQRRDALMDAAARVLAAKGWRGVSLNGIAREANISKANVYRYFQSAEELFLHMLLDDQQAWADDVIPQLEALAGSDDDEAVIAVIVRSFAERPRLCQLFSVLQTVLEQNVSVDTIVWFKTQTLGNWLRATLALQGALSYVDEEGARILSSSCYFLVAGMWVAAHPSPAVQQALQRPELTFACVSFERDLTAALAVTLAGLRARAT